MCYQLKHSYSKDSVTSENAPSKIQFLLESIVENIWLARNESYLSNSDPIEEQTIIEERINRMDDSINPIFIEEIDISQNFDVYQLNQRISGISPNVSERSYYAICHNNIVYIELQERVEHTDIIRNFDNSIDWHNIIEIINCRQ